MLELESSGYPFLFVYFAFFFIIFPVYVSSGEIFVYIVALGVLSGPVGLLFLSCLQIVSSSFIVIGEIVHVHVSWFIR